MYALTDEAYALTAGRPACSLSSARVLWLQAFCQSYWVAGSVAGALLGSWLALDLLGLTFTLTALFVVLAMDAVRAERDLPTPVLAFCCALLALVVAPGTDARSSGMGLFVWRSSARSAVRGLCGKARAAPMPDTPYLVAASLTMFAVTFALRALPFADPAAAARLRAGRLPRAATCRPASWSSSRCTRCAVVSLGDGAARAPEAIALVVTVALHLWKRNAVASIIGGTAVYIALVNLVFV